MTTGRINQVAVRTSDIFAMLSTLCNSAAKVKIIQDYTDLGSVSDVIMRVHFISEMEPQLALLWHCPKKTCKASFVPDGKDYMKAATMELFAHLEMNPRFNNLALLSSCLILQVSRINLQGSSLVQETPQGVQGEVKPLHDKQHLNYSLPRLTRNSRAGEQRIDIKDERFVSRYIANAIYCIIWKYRDIPILRIYCDILMIFSVHDNGQL